MPWQYQLEFYVLKMTQTYDYEGCHPLDEETVGSDKKISFFWQKLSYVGKIFSFGGINKKWKNSYVEVCNLSITKAY